MHDTNRLEDSSLRVLIIVFNLLVCLLLLPTRLHAAIANPPTLPTDRDQKSESILDSYETIQNLYAYDPASKDWVQIKYFTIVSAGHNAKPTAFDRTLYTNFWAYDASSRIWYRVNLVPYLQQLSHVAPPTKDIPSSLERIAPGELLEELLDTSIATVKQQEDTIWSHFSLQCSTGAGMVFYENDLVKLRLLERGHGEMFFITDTNKVYKPNWFYHTLNQVNDFDMGQLYQVERGTADLPKFRGRGWAWPITLELQYTFCLPLFVGVGREIIFNYIPLLTHNDPNIKNKKLVTNKKWSIQGRWFVKGGYYVFRNAKHRFFVDIRLFYVHHLGNKFYKGFTFGSYLNQAWAYNIGLGYEQQLTTSFSFTTRFAVELQPFKQFPQNSSYNIKYKQPAIYLQMGLSWQCAQREPLKYSTPDQRVKNQKLPSLNKAEMQGLLDLD